MSVGEGLTAAKDAAATVGRVLTPGVQGVSGIVVASVGFYLLYVDPGPGTAYVDVRWVAVLLVSGGLLLGHAAGSA